MARFQLLKMEIRSNVKTETKLIKNLRCIDNIGTTNCMVAISTNMDVTAKEESWVQRPAISNMVYNAVNNLSVCSNLSLKFNAKLQQHQIAHFVIQSIIYFRDRINGLVYI